VKISKEFQGFFFGAVIPEIKKAQQPMKYQNPYTQKWHLVDMTKVSDNAVYNLMKILNPHYPKFEGLLPASTTVLGNKHLTQHIQWIERWLAQNGHTARYIEEKWNEIMRNAGIEKGD